MVDLASPAKERSSMPAKSKKQHVIDELTAQIRRGEYRPGDKLPSGRELRETYGVSDIVIRGAMDRLIGAGLVESVAGVGYFVVAQPHD